MCDSGVYSREISDTFFVGHMSVLVKNFNIRIFPGTINVINVKLRIMVLLIRLYLFIPLLAIFQGHSNVRQF